MAVVLFASVGCSSENTIAPDSSKADVEEGGNPSPQRDKCQQFLSELANARSAEAEAEILTDFAEWLRDHDCKIEVAEIDGKHRLSCPYFPPVTPWIDYEFFDMKNLALLPHDYRS